MKTTPENITSLEPNQIFVFGSNTAGIHGAGAALLAAKKFGAIRGDSEGFTGQCYAIPTRKAFVGAGQFRKFRLETLPLDEIEKSVRYFLMIAKHHPDHEFLVTKIGCGYAGYEPSEIKEMFQLVPPNVILPKEFLPETQ